MWRSHSPVSARRTRPRRPPLDDRTLHVLEFPAVLARLAAQTAFSAGREAALSLRPVADYDTVVRRQRETGEAVALDRVGLTLPFAGAHDVRERALAADRGQVLTAAELLDVASLCRAALAIRRAVVRAQEDVPLLANIAGGIGELGPLRVLIDDVVDERGGVRDSASPELERIRREVHAAHERVKQRIQSMAASSSLQNALQEPIVVMREGRYVLPVKSDFRGAVRGIVHDTSSSGATVYVEPLVVIDLANAWRELQLAERHEVERILRELSSAVGSAAGDLADAVERLAYLDVAQAKARLAASMHATDLCSTSPRQAWLLPPPGPGESAEYRLVEARHPLLNAPVVPTSLHVGGPFDALLITGPNTGGKTVALKTAGLLCAMALAGLAVPAAPGTQVPVYGNVFADIGDEQSIEQSLSTFSGHITAIIDIMERAGPGALVLLDELGAGTDPTEGAALAIAIVERLTEQGAALIATTHHSELKLYAHQTEHVQNASVEFDLQTLRPTYRLTIGLPGQSNALAIARNLGMPAHVIERAHAALSPETRDLEGLLGDLRNQLTAAETRAEHAATTAAAAEALRMERERELAQVRAEIATLRGQTREQARRQLREVERLVERTRREVESARLAQARADLERLQRTVAHVDAPTEDQAEASSPPVPQRRDEIEVEPGAVIWLAGMPTPGEAISEPGPTGEFEVQLGALRTRVRLEQVVRAEPASRARVVLGRIAVLASVDIPGETDVRGQSVDEAVPAVERFIDAAARSGRARVRLIHGKGTGTLRRAVRDLLARHPLVTRYESGDRAEGGEGVTVAYLEGM